MQKRANQAWKHACASCWERILHRKYVLFLTRFLRLATTRAAVRTSQLSTCFSCRLLAVEPHSAREVSGRAQWTHSCMLIVSYAAGELVVFRSTQTQPWLRSASSTRANSQPRSASRLTSSASPSQQGSGANTGPEDRFMSSYDALSNAMADLAKKSGEGRHGVRDSDVLQLMSSDFIARRVQTDARRRQSKQRSGRRDKSLARAALTQSATHDFSLAPSAVASIGYLPSIQALHSTTSQVTILDVADIVPSIRGRLTRNRFSSLP